MKNSWFGTTAVPALEAFLPTYRLTRGKLRRRRHRHDPFWDLRPFLGMAPSIQSLGDAPACLIFKHYLPIPPGRQSVAIDNHATLQYRNMLIFSLLKSGAYTNER